MRERRWYTRWFGVEPPLPYLSFLSWPLLWVIGWVLDRFDRSLYEWDEPLDG